MKTLQNAILLKYLKFIILFLPKSTSSPLLDEGYLLLRNHGSLEKIRRFLNQLIKLETDRIDYPKTAKHISLDELKIFQLQKTCQSLFLDDKLTRSVALSAISNSKIWFPLKSEWLDSNPPSELEFNRFICKILWIIFRIQEFIKAIRNLSGPMVHSGILNPLSSSIGRKIILLDIPVGSFPILNKETKSECFVNWIVASDKTKVPITLYHSLEVFKEEIQISPQVNAIYFPSTTDCWFLRRFFLNIKSALRFYWNCASFSRWNLLKFTSIIGDLALANQIHLLQRPLQDCEIFFNASQGIVRPLWTYEAERMGAIITFVSLSISAAPEIEGSMGNVEWERLLNWNKIWVNDLAQEKQAIEFSFLPALQINCAGPAWWTDNGVALPTSQKTKRRYLSVFDIEPVKNHYGYSTLNDLNYDRVETTLAFLETILELAIELDLHILHKSKRDIQERRFREYSNFVNQSSRSHPTHYTCIDSATAPSRLIRESLGVISMPFTTTSVIARYMDVPTCYFDVTGKIGIHDVASRGITTINSKATLLEWLRSV